MAWTEPEGKFVPVIVIHDQPPFMVRADFDLTFRQLNRDYNMWLCDKSLSDHYRFGQFMWNKYGKPGTTWPRLFYASEEEAYPLLLAATCLPAAISRHKAGE